MSHWRSMFDNRYLGNWDLPRGKDVVVTIAKVEAGELTSQGGRRDKKPLVYFRGKEKALVCNKTIAKCIAAMFGDDTRKWVGQAIALYVTTTDSPDGRVDCIRVRPKAVRAAPADEPPASEPPPPSHETRLYDHERQPAEREPGSDDE